MKATDLIYTCSVAMYNYLQYKDLQDLLDALLKVEERYKELHGGDNMGICFRFGSDDTLCTTIKEIETDLSLPENHDNHKLMLERFKVIFNRMEAGFELEVYYQ